MTKSNKKEIETMIAELALKLKHVKPEIAEKVLESSIDLLHKLVELNEESDELFKRAVKAETEGDYITAVNLYWESGVKVQNQFENTYSQTLKIMSVAKCLFKLKMHFLSGIFFEKVKVIVVEERLKDKIPIVKLNETISICDNYITEIRSIYPYIYKKIREKQAQNEYCRATSALTGLEKKTLSFFNFASFLSGDLILKKFMSAPKKEIAGINEEIARAYLMCRRASALGIRYLRIALGMFELMQDEESTKRIKMLMEGIKIN